MAEPQHFWYPIIPVQVLRVNREEIPAREGAPRRVEDVQRLMDKLAKFTKALVHGPDVGRLLAGLLERCACELTQLLVLGWFRERVFTIVGDRNPERSFDVIDDGGLRGQPREARTLRERAGRQGPGAKYKSVKPPQPKVRSFAEIAKTPFLVDSSVVPRSL